MRAVAVVLLLVSASHAEDVQLRARAFELVERAREVSTPANSNPVVNEMNVTFRARSADGTTHDGTYRRVFGGQGRIREEFTLADFHLTRILTGDRVAYSGPQHTLPPEIREMLALLPIQLWHLDETDVVRDIRQTTRKGVAARCVEFDTIRGADTENNEMCFDAQTGDQVYNRSGNMELENAGFFDFAGAREPGHITQYRNGVVVYDVQLTRKPLDTPPGAELFAPPEGGEVANLCRTARPAFAKSMPQPAGNGGAVTNIVVRALIGADGAVQSAWIERSDRPDLNDEALKIARTWTFTPAVCNGHPNPAEYNITIRFEGR